MYDQIKTAVQRSQDTLWQDAVGGVALMVIFAVGLHLPGLI